MCFLQKSNSLEKVTLLDNYMPLWGYKPNQTMFMKLKAQLILANKI